MAIHGASRPGPTRDGRVDEGGNQWQSMEHRGLVPLETAELTRCQGVAHRAGSRLGDGELPTRDAHLMREAINGNQWTSMAIHRNQSQSIHCRHAASGDAHEGGELVAINGNQGGMPTMEESWSSSACIFHTPGTRMALECAGEPVASSTATPTSTAPSLSSSSCLTSCNATSLSTAPPASAVPSSSSSRSGLIAVVPRLV